jgi:hypothetical protein
MPICAANLIASSLVRREQVIVARNLVGCEILQLRQGEEKNEIKRDEWQR